jgi:hypothetical protein
MIVKLSVGRAAVAAALLAASLADAAEVVVLESSAALYTVGQTLPAEAPIKLRSGETLVLATEDSRLLRLAGPHDGAIGAAPAPERSAVRKTLARLVGGDESRIGGVGAARGDEGTAATADSRPDPWLIHAAIGGDQCVLRARPAELWRETTESSGSAQVNDAASTAAATVRWSEAQSRAAWPVDALPPTDARVYLVRFADTDRSVAIRLHLLDAGVAADELVAAAWLAAKGCTPQARMVLR